VAEPLTDHFRKGLLRSRDILLNGKMGMRPMIIGVCHICEQTKKLSFEHCPPEKAFNEDPIVYAEMKPLWGGGDIDNLKGKEIRNLRAVLESPATETFVSDKNAL
jgi:hypothetical protein